MDKVRRTIRRVKTTAEATFDDQLWPINVVLVVMAAFVGGLLLGSERSVMFKSLGLAAVTTIIGALIFGVSTYHGRVARRFQLSSALSLLLSLLIVVATGYYDFIPAEFRFKDERKRPPVEQAPRRVVQHFVEQQTDQPKDFEKPVETSKAEQETTATAAAKQDVSHPVAARPKTSATSESQVTDPVQPKLTRTDAPQSAARSKKVDSQATKVSTNSPTQVQQVDAPQVATEAPKTPQRPQPKVSSVARRETPSEAKRQVTKADPTAVARPTVTAVPRRQSTPEKVTTPTRPTTQPTKSIAQAQPSNTTPVAAQPTQVATPAKPVAAPAPTATASLPRRTSQTTAEKASAAPSTPQVNQPRPATSNISKAIAQPSSESVRSAPSSTARVQLPTSKPTPQRVEQVAAKAPQTPSQTRPGPQASSAAVANKSAAGRVTPGRKSAEPQPTRHQGPSAQQLAKAADSAAGGATPVTKAATPTERASSPGAKAIASSAPAPNPATAAVQPTARPTQAQPSTGAVAARSESAPNPSALRRALQVDASSPTQATVGGAQRAAKSPDVAQPNASHVAKSQPAKSKTSANVSQSRVDFSNTPVTDVASTASPTAQPTQGNVNRQVQTDNLRVSKHGIAPLRTSQQHVSTDEMSVASKADPTLRPQLAMRSTQSKTRSQVDRADTTAQQVEQPQLNTITATVPAAAASPESGSLEQSVSTNAGTNAEKSKQLDGEVSRLAGSASVEAERAAASNPNVESPQSHAGQSARIAADLADAATQPQAVHAPQVAAVGSSEPQVAGPAGVDQAKATDVAAGDGQPQRKAGDAPAASLTSGPSSQPIERATGDAAQPAVDSNVVAAAARESTTGAKVNVAEVNAPAAAPLNTVAHATSQPTAGGSTGAERSQAQAAAIGDKTAATAAPTAGAAATAVATAGQPAAAGETGAPAATAIATNDTKAAPSDAVVENVRADVVAPGKVETTGPTVAVNADGKASASDRSVTAASGTPNKATQGAAEGAPQATAEITALTRATSGTEGPSVEKHETALAKASGPSGVRDTAVKIDAVAPAASVGPEATAVVSSPVAGASRRKIRATLPVLELPVGEVGGRVANVSQPTFNLSRRKTDMVAPAIDSRFITEKEVGGGSVDARVQAKAFQERGAGKEGDDDFSTHTEDAIEDGLKFLSRWQKDDGRWSLHDNFGESGGEDEIATSQSDTAATGLALLSYLGAGYDPVNAQRYRQQIRDGLDYLIRNQRTKGKDGTSAADDGDLYVPSNEASDKNARLYSHAIATMALCEAYGMSQDPRYRDAAQRAIKFIESSQSKKLGGWRYTPGFEADTSVTGWMVTALKSGELAGLRVDKKTYERTKKWLKSASDKGSFGYAYNPLAQDKGETKRLGWRNSSKAMTAVGLLTEMYFGRPKKDPRMVQGAQYLQQRLPEVEDGYIDTYYWYYATQVMRHMDGEYWQDWKKSIRPMLLDNQLKQGRLAGSWSPTFSRGVTNRWGDDRWGKNGGRIYVTTLNLLTLEVDYRKLPLYQTDE